MNLDDRARAESIRATLSRYYNGPRARMRALLREPEQPTATAAPQPISDADFFRNNPDRKYRVRDWQRSDRPDLMHPRDMPLRMPLCSVVELGRFGPVVVAQPATLDLAIVDSDDGAAAIVKALARDWPL